MDTASTLYQYQIKGEGILEILRSSTSHSFAGDSFFGARPPFFEACIKGASGQ